MEDMTIFNNTLLDGYHAYANFTIGKETFAVPYFINYMGDWLDILCEKGELSLEQKNKLKTAYRERETGYGWYRGKGTPDEIREAIYAAFREEDLDIQKATTEGILSVMKLYGIGIDCSGFIFHLLLSAFKAIHSEELFLNSLDWRERKHQAVTVAGTFVFAGNASHSIPVTQLGIGDLLLFKRDGVYKHIAMCVKKDDQYIFMHSGLKVSPDGVNTVTFQRDGSTPVFHMNASLDPDWNEEWKMGNIEVRRLAAVEQVFAEKQYLAVDNEGMLQS